METHAEHAAAVAETSTLLHEAAKELASIGVIWHKGMDSTTPPKERERMARELASCIDIGRELLDKTGYLDEWRDDQANNFIEP